MASEGPNSPSAAANDTAPVGGVNWTNPTNIFASDNDRAAKIIDASGHTFYLLATDFGFSIVRYASIEGIVVTIERKGIDVDTIKDYSIKIIKDGVVSGNDKKATVIFWPTVDTNKNYGSAVSGWGLTWSPDDINASNFGVAVAAENMDAGDNRDARIDWIGITVYYRIGQKSGVAVGYPAIY